MLYLPYKSDQEAEARHLMVQMFELVFPRKIAEVVVKRDVKFIYDRETQSWQKSQCCSIQSMK